MGKRIMSNISCVTRFIPECARKAERTSPGVATPTHTVCARHVSGSRGSLRHDHHAGKQCPMCEPRTTLSPRDVSQVPFTMDEKTRIDDAKSDEGKAHVLKDISLVITLISFAVPVLEREYFQLLPR